MIVFLVFLRGRHNDSIRRQFLASLAIILFSGSLLPRTASPPKPAQPPQLRERTDAQRDDYRKAMEEADQKIADEVKAHSELMKNLEYLTTQIGARLTGSPQMQAASDWTLKRFKDYGIDAHLETARDRSRLDARPGDRRDHQPRPEAHRHSCLRLEQGYRRRRQRAKSIALDIEKPADLDQYKGKLKGKIVMLRKPADMSKLDPNPENAYDAVIAPQRGVPEHAMGFRERMQILKTIAAEQPALMLMDSGKTDSLYNMTGGYRPAYTPTKIPMAFLTHEDYDLLYRLLQAGPVTMKFNLQDTFTDKPVPASITVAEIKGTEHPEERVIIGGHLDSWDLGQGALDNGTGAMATLEAARTLQALGWKPKRTITFILFTGEEQGGVGATRSSKITRRKWRRSTRC